MIALDTNVLIYACDKADLKRQQVALDLVSSANDLGRDDRGRLPGMRRYTPLLGGPAGPRGSLAAGDCEPVRAGRVIAQGHVRSGGGPLEPNSLTG